MAYGDIIVQWNPNLVLFLQTILQIPGFMDNVFTHLLAGLGAGFFAVCIGSPIDVVSVLLLVNLANKSY